MQATGAIEGRAPRGTLLLWTVVALSVAMIIGCSESGNGDGAAADDREFVHGYGLGECTWPEEQQILDDDPDIDVYEGVLQCRGEMSDPRVSGLEEWTLVDPHYLHYTTNPRTGRFEASVVLLSRTRPRIARSTSRCRSRVSAPFS